MVRGVINALAFLLSLIVADHCAHATEPTIITLSCDRTVKVSVGKDQSAAQPINKVGIIVNLAERTVSFTGYTAHIDSADAAVISFGGDARMAIQPCVQRAISTA